MNWKKSFSVLTISLLLAMSSVTAKADETDKTETLSEVPVLTQAEEPKKNDDLNDKDLNQQTSNEEVEDIKNSTSVEVEIEEAKPAAKVNAAADADPMRTFNIDDWDVNTVHDGVLIIGGLKNQSIKNIYIPSYVSIAGQERRVQFNDLDMFVKKEKDLKRFESIIFEAIGPDSNPTAVQKVILGTPAGEAISLSNVFANHPVLSNVDLKGLDVSRVTNISGIFGGSLAIRNLDVSNWDTSNVTNMSSAFRNTQTLLHIDLKDWDTSKVTDMSNMFKESGLWEVNFPNWKTGNVTTMQNMFSGMPQLYETDFKNWDTSKVTDFSGMFAFTKGLRNLDLSAFNTSSATTMGGMFNELGGIQSMNLSSFDTRNVTDFSFMFNEVNIPKLDISNFDTGKAKTMASMFRRLNLLDSSGGGYGKIGKLDVSHFKMNNVETIESMFQGSNLEELDVTNWNVDKVKNANSSFSGMQNLKSINPGNWNTSGFKDVSYIFKGTYKLEYIDLHNWKINITDINNNRNLFQLGQYLQKPLVVKTSDPFLLGYNYAKDFRLTAGPKKLAMEGKFSDDTTAQSLFNRYTIQDEAELVVSAADYNAFMHDLPTPTNPLLSFKEWQYNDEKNIKKVFVDKTESTDIRKDSRVYEAQYESHKLTVKFHVDDAITEVKTEPNTKVDQTKIPETDKTGYTFKGWVYLNEPTKPFDPATVVIVEDTEVKAVYEINKVKVTFDNEGDLTEAITDYNTAVKPADIPTVTKVGHTFKEWNTKADGTGVKFVGTELITEDRTVYAIFTVNQLSVTFNDEGTVNIQNVDYGTALKTNQIPTPVGKIGHTFKEWNTAPDGNGTKFVGTEVITSNTVVFAVYTVNEVSVTFINDTQLDTATTTYNSALNPSDIPIATKTGHTFVEWNTSPDGSGSEFVGTELITENRTVYAIFTANPVKVTFDNEGDLTEAITDYNTAVKPADIPTVTKVGHTFKEWNTKADGTGVKFVGTELITEDRTVYAIFTANPVKVTFDNEGDLTEAITDYNTAVKPADIPTVTKVGHTFKEWNTKADGTGVKFVGTELITEDRTVYAIYTVNEFIVTFIDGLKSYTATVKYDAKLLANQIPTVSRTGYTFKNWNLSSDGTAGIFNPLNEKITKNVTVYAMYDINEYAVTFIDGDKTTVVNALYNTKLDQSKVPTAKKDGYTFKEWNTSADGLGTSFNPVEAIITENITVYAIYTKDVIAELEVTFIDGDTTTVVNALYNTKLDQSKVPTAKKDGYTFKEWNTSADGLGTSFNPVEALITENITVYAIYSKDTVKPVLPETGVTNNNSAIIAGAMLLISGMITLVLRKKEEVK